MRIDKFLNVVNITKRRAISEDMCKSGVVNINNQVAKASKDVKIGDEISIKFIEHIDIYKVLDIPVSKNIPKNMQEKYVIKIK
ncbi:RNA-binding S4 domain-containing protein [Campylobacter insulaenigrae]|uniref:Ribosome-associated heat shock protein (S4 domain) n=1 Tax=Campylobacter insulaenigrae NCTC 12927 TaxID=1031564 RepID=A0A0A8H184_9BACT|nr:RNA-binding S4 domain-containing protein [Campylobacter insulaenigrae]AJC87697.1 ribosome-associated heat shock protein (S4 domain) [Campylobacter insulaenigrae NCTC 12927]VEH93932.1 S4 RNA-binding domain protein [Campylobacter insulaenigrae]